MTGPLYAGVDIGGTQCSVSLATYGPGELTLVQREQFATRPERGPEVIVADIGERLERLLAGAAPGRAEGVGVSCGGPLDASAGLVLSPPNLPGWDRVPLVERLSERLALPCWLENDANAGALAEWLWGAARGTRTCVFLTFGTGLGAGLILDGRLHRGVAGLAGEVGHWALRPGSEGPAAYGKSGSFESFCSGSGLLRWYRHLSGDADPGLSAAVVAERARAGDPHAVAVYAQAGSLLGEGIALLADLLAPEVVVVGGVYGYATDLLRPHMERSLRRELHPALRDRCRVAVAALGPLTGSHAALAVAVLKASPHLLSPGPVSEALT